MKRESSRLKPHDNSLGHGDASSVWAWRDPKSKKSMQTKRAASMPLFQSSSWEKPNWELWN